MSSEGASLVAHRVLLPRDAPVLRDAENKDVMERIPVEIWREILLICIACPLLLQWDGDQYHIIPRIVEIDCGLVAKYKQSERIRKRLRLVCPSWNQFLDEHSDRLVQLTPRVQSGYWPPVKQWDRVVRIDGPTYTYCFCDESCWPPSLHGDDWVSNIDSPSHISPSERSTIRDHLTRLSERCKAVSLPGFWRDELVEKPGLGSATILKEDFYGQHNVSIRMSALSNTYQKLTYLDIHITTINNPSVGLELPFLTTLRLTTRGNLVPNAANSSIAGAIGTWTLPNIELIDFDMLCASEGEIEAFNLLIRRVGRTVSTMIIGNHDRRGVGSTSILAADIWPLFPALTCLGMGSTDLLHVSGPPHNLGGPLIDLRFDTKGMWFTPSLVKDLTRVFPTKWPASILGHVTLDITWERAVRMKGSGVLTPSHLALFDVLHHTGKGLADSAGIPFDSTIREAFLGRPQDSSQESEY